MISDYVEIMNERNGWLLWYKKLYVLQ
jgi:hypothetical protein